MLRQQEGTAPHAAAPPAPPQRLLPLRRSRSYVESEGMLRQQEEPPEPEHDHRAPSSHRITMEQRGQGETTAAGVSALEQELARANSPSSNQVSLRLFSRLTGFEPDSQAAAMYLQEARNDVEAAVRAAVQGANYNAT
mmetsp:Transcript_22759/g.57898  ORF Transcript_22759/g.57898 Transcript_22759/m.57898 type:complete len:138 (+) Transcript_22759:3-416(+)